MSPARLWTVASCDGQARSIEAFQEATQSRRHRQTPADSKIRSCESSVATKDSLKRASVIACFHLPHFRQTPTHLPDTTTTTTMHPDRPNMHPHRASGEVINEPAPAHIPLDQYDTESDDGDREATELRTIDPNAQRPRVSRVLSNERPVEHWYDHVRKAWRHQIRISVPHVDCRDHLGRWKVYHGVGGLRGWRWEFADVWCC